MKIVFLLLFLVVLSCSDNSFKVDNRTYNLSSRRIEVSNPFVGAESIEILRDFIILSNTKSYDDKYLRVYDSSGMFLMSLLKNGNGPDEIPGLVVQSVHSADDFFYGVTLYSNELFKISIDSMNFHVDEINKSFKQLPVETSVINDLIILNDSLAIGQSSSDFVKNEFISLNLNSPFNFLGHGTYPELHGKNMRVKSTDLYELYYKQLAAHPDGTKFAALYGNYNLLRIYDTEFNLLNEFHIDEPDILEPKLQQGLLSTQKIDLSKSKTYYIDLAVNDDYIFGLGFDKSNQELRGMSVRDMNELKAQITVWDWKGIKLFELKLDQPIYKFSTKGNAIYGITPSSDSNIYVYEMDF